MTTRSERFRSLALAVLLTIGAGVMWGAILGCGLGILSTFTSPRENYEQLIFLRDGTPIIGSYPGGNYTLRTYRTLDGKRVEVEDDGVGVAAGLPGPPRQNDRFSRLQWPQRIAPVYGRWDGTEIWYFIHDGQLQGRGYLVGYDKMAKLCVGYIGRNGFRADEPPREEQFPVDGRKVWPSAAILNRSGSLDAKYLLTSDGLVQINLRKRAVKVLWEADRPISAALSNKPRVHVDEAAGQPSTLLRILLRTSDRVLVLDLEGKQVEAYTIPSELRKVGLRWLLLPGDGALIAKSRLGRRGPPGDELFWIDKTGKIVRHQQVDLQQSVPNPKAVSVLASVVAPVPAGFAGFIVVAPLLPSEYSAEGSYQAGLAKVLADAWPGLLIATTVSVVLAWLCYRRQCKWGLPWTPVWTVLVLFLGLPAFFGYLAHRQWSALLPCPNCGRPVPRDRPGCFACGRGFPAPALKGTEVFA